MESIHSTLSIFSCVATLFQIVLNYSLIHNILHTYINVMSWFSVLNKLAKTLKTIFHIVIMECLCVESWEKKLTLYNLERCCTITECGKMKRCEYFPDVRYLLWYTDIKSRVIIFVQNSPIRQRPHKCRFYERLRFVRTLVKKQRTEQTGQELQCREV